MKIKNKLTLLFMLIIAVLLLIINFYIYSLSQSYASNDFFKRLRERVYATANVFLEEDEVSKKAFMEFQGKYLEKFPGEIIRVYDSLNQPAFIPQPLHTGFPKTLIEKIRKEKVYQEKVKNQYTYGIFYVDNQGDFVIIASAVDEIGDAKLIHLRIVLLVGFVISVILVFFIGRIFTKQMLKPISVIIRQANKITETNLHLRLNEGNRKDELAELAMTFNSMLKRLEGAFELQQDFIGNASHELRTPLTSIIGTIDVTLSRERTADEYRQVLNTIMEETERLHKISDGLLNIAQANFDISNMRMDEIRIDDLLEEAKDIVQNQVPGSIMELNFENMPVASDELVIRGNKNLLLIALENLIENANKFSDNRKVNINLLNEPERVVITIKDCGIGIPEKDILHVMQTFYRADNARTFSGSGIGLSLSQKILHLHKAKLEIQSKDRIGTTVSVIFPKT